MRGSDGPKPDGWEDVGFEATVGQICELFGVTPRAIRFYDEHGLVRARRDTLNRRRFGLGARRRLEIVILLRRAGVGINDIRSVLGCAEQRGSFGRIASLLRTRLEALDRERASVLLALAKLEQAAA